MFFCIIGQRSRRSHSQTKWPKPAPGRHAHLWDANVLSFSWAESARASSSWWSSKNWKFSPQLNAKMRASYCTHRPRFTFTHNYDCGACDAEICDVLHRVCVCVCGQRCQIAPVQFRRRSIQRILELELERQPCVGWPFAAHYKFLALQYTCQRVLCFQKIK